MDGAEVTCRGSGAHIAVEPGVYLVTCPECGLLMPLENLWWLAGRAYEGTIIRH